MWEWIVTNKLLILSLVLNFIAILDRFATATPEDYKLFKIPIGKYDDEIVKFLKFVRDAFIPGK